MTDLKRITPEHAASLFERNAIKPTPGTYFRRNDDGRQCGCVVTAIVADICGMRETEAIAQCGGVALERRAVQLGYDQAYIDGLMNGFDRIPKPRNELPSFHLGYEDGLAIRLRVLCEPEGGAV